MRICLRTILPHVLMIGFWREEGSIVEKKQRRFHQHVVRVRVFEYCVTLVTCGCLLPGPSCRTSPVTDKLSTPGKCRVLSVEVVMVLIFLYSEINFQFFLYLLMLMLMYMNFYCFNPPVDTILFVCSLIYFLENCCKLSTFHNFTIFNPNLQK